MKAQLYEIGGPQETRLAILARPRGGDWLTDEIESWHEQNVDVVVSLLTPAETVEFDLSEEARAVTESGMTFFSFPIPDRGVPVVREAFSELVAQLAQLSAGGKTIGVHCRAGIGRSSMLLAALLIAAGMTPDEAFDQVQRSRGAPVPDTSEQRDWIGQFAQQFTIKVS